MAYNVVLRRNGAKVGHFGPFSTKKQAIAQGQVLADDSARDVVVSVEPQRKKATTKRKNTRWTRTNTQPETYILPSGKRINQGISRALSRESYKNDRRGTPFIVYGHYMPNAGQYDILYYRKESFQPTHLISVSPATALQTIKKATKLLSTGETLAATKRALKSMRTNTRRTRKNGPTLGKPHYPFAEKEKLYATFTDARLYSAMQDAMATSRAQQGWNEAGANWYLDDYHTIVKEIQKRKRAKKRNPSRGTFKSKTYAYYTVAGGKLTSGHSTRKAALKQASGQKANVKTAKQAQKYVGRSLTSSASWHNQPRKNPARTRSNPASKSILKRIDLANKWIAFAQKRDIRGIDTSSTWHSSLTYTHKIAVSAAKNRATVKYTEDFAPGKKQSETYNLNDTDTYSDTGVSALRYAINTYIIKAIKRGAKDEGVTIPASLR